MDGDVGVCGAASVCVMLLRRAQDVRGCASTLQIFPNDMMGVGRWAGTSVLQQ